MSQTFTDADVAEQGHVLRLHAEHFVQTDWDYRRGLGSIVAVRYDFPEDRPWGRLKSAARWLLRRQPEFAKGWGPNRFAMARFALRRDAHLPDGSLDGGNILTFWEETGEYVQMVQPSVGSLIADFLEAEPGHPHAVRIATELARIRARYGERCDSGEVTSAASEGS